ncbi:MAG: hypothetical protein ACYDGO_01745 [Smithellaceae bacterium]
MPSSLSGGFDFQIQLSISALQKVLQAVYKSGMIPNFLSQELNILGEQYQVDIYLDEPKLDFAYDPSLSNLIAFKQPLVLRREAVFEEYSGYFRFTTELYKTSKVIEGSQVDFITLDFSSATPENIQLDLPVDPFLQGLIKAWISSVLVTQIMHIPVSPSIPQDGPMKIGYWNFKEFYDPEFSPPQNSESYYQHNFLSFFINTFPGEMPLPDAVQLFLRYTPQSTPNPSPYNVDYAISLPADMIYKAINEVINAMNFPSAVQGQSDVFLNSINMSLQDGRIHFSGNLTYIVSGPIEAEFDFEGNCGLHISGDRLEISSPHLVVDPPWWIDLLNLLPFIGQIFIGMIQRAIEEATSNISFGVDIPNLTFFVSDIAVTTGTPPSTPAVKFTNSGSIAIFSTGLVVKGIMEILVNEVEIKKPRYITAHKDTMEFHRDFCVYGKKIKHKLQFINEEHAWSQGYNGCGYCCPDYDRIASGDLSFWIKAPGYTEGEEVTIEFDIQGELLEQIGRRGSINPISQHLSKQDTINEDGNYGTFIGYDDLMSGKWQFTIKSGSWSIKFTCSVIGDRTRHMQLIIGQDKYETIMISGKK